MFGIFLGLVPVISQNISFFFLVQAAKSRDFDSVKRHVSIEFYLMTGCALLLSLGAGFYGNRLATVLKTNIDIATRNALANNSPSFAYNNISADSSDIQPILFKSEKFHKHQEPQRAYSPSTSIPDDKTRSFSSSPVPPSPSSPSTSHPAYSILQTVRELERARVRVMLLSRMAVIALISFSAMTLVYGLLYISLLNGKVAYIVMSIVNWIPALFVLSTYVSII